MSNDTSPTEPSSAAPGDAGAQADAARLAGALRRARLVLAWEAIWPPLASLATVALLFAAFSWAGLWAPLPPLGRIAGLIVFAALALVVLWPLRHVRWPTAEVARQRLDRLTGMAHRPVTAITDRLAGAPADPLTAALWQTHLRRTKDHLGTVRAGLPRSRLASVDPMALRAAVILFAVVAFFAAGAERWQRLKSAFDFSGAMHASTVRLDAWVSPPPYTARAPILLTGNQPGAKDTDFTVPAASTLTIRASAAKIDVQATGEIEDAPEDKNVRPPPAGVTERRLIIRGSSTLRVSAPAQGATWRFSAIADLAPTISLLKDPEPQARGSLLLAYAVEDDYGVVAARAELMPTFGGKKAAANSGPRPLFKAPDFALVLPPGRARQGKAQTIKDITDHPFAGAEVDLVLVARDEAGNEGRSEPKRFTLPLRPFSNPLARALVELRRLLALDADQRPLVSSALDALLVAPAVFTQSAGTYLGLRTVASALEHAGTDEELRSVVGEMWALAIAIEDGKLTDVEKDLRAAQEALRQALERGADADEIKKLMENLRAAIEKYLKQVIEQALRNPQQQNPLDQNSRNLSDQDLRSMLDQMERMARSGDRDGARQMLEQLQAMLDNLRMARPGEEGEGRSAMNELADILRKQQRLRDRTFQEGRNPQSGQNGQRGKNDQGLGGLRQDQQALRDRLNQLLDQLRKRGLVPQPGQQPGQNGEGNEEAQGGQQLGEAGQSMGEAQGQLGEGDSGGAVDSQGRAIEQLRRGAQGLAQALQGQQGDGKNQQSGEGRGNQPGRQAGDSPLTDPLGRPYRGRDLGNDTTVKVPGEIDIQRARRILDELRRRFSEPGRPQIELEYLERLLQDY